MIQLPSFSVLVGGGAGGHPLAEPEGRPPPVVLISEAPLEEPLTRAPALRHSRAPRGADNRTNDDSGSQNGAQMGPLNGAQKRHGQMSHKR